MDFKKNKRFLMKIFLFFTLFLLTGHVHAQTHQYLKKESTSYIYRDLGTYQSPFPNGTSIGISAYVTKEINNTGFYPEYRYIFTLFAISNSIYNRHYTETWLYGVRVFVDNFEVTYNQYPYGFTSYVKTIPTVIYYWYTNSENVGTYFFKWESSAYELR